MTDQKPVLTNRQGHPVHDNQNQRTVGPRGPATLENYQFLEKISHFDRERIPERVVHARGVTTFGYFEATGKIGDEPASKYTRAKLFQPLPKQQLTEEDHQRLATLGSDPPRKPSGSKITGSVEVKRIADVPGAAGGLVAG